MEDDRALRIRLVGGPKARQFDVFDADTGAKYTNIVAVSVDINSETPMCVLTFREGIEIDATMDGEVEVHAVVLPRKAKG